MNIFVSPVLVQNVNLGDQDVMIAVASTAKSPRVENGDLEKLRASLKEEITSEIKGLVIESQDVAKMPNPTLEETRLKKRISPTKLV